MSGTMMAVLGFVAMLLLIAARAPIGLSMLLVGAVGYSQLSSGMAFFSYMKTNSYHQFANYTLSVIPLFILMGALAEKAGIAGDLFRAAGRAFGNMRGGLAMAVIGACTAFGAICGSSVATTATFGRAALPELLKARYDGGLATGTIAVGGTLGILIPPSVILVVYAITTEQNIAKLFQAALIPGLMAAVSYCIVIAIVVWRNPELAPLGAKVAFEKTPSPFWTRILSAIVIALAAYWFYQDRIDIVLAVGLVVLGLSISFIDATILPAIMIAIVVVGGIYGGVFTPTEGAAVGAITMLAVALLGGKLSWKDVFEALRQTAETSGMIFIILLGAEVLALSFRSRVFRQLPLISSETPVYRLTS
jgi:C4-dicarboxylate transporter, DctM subunit